jgi:hypothetical protein
VNGSQSKLLAETWPISQIEPDAPLFYLDQDRLTIDKLSALGTRLETTAEKIDVGKTRCKIDDKNRIEEQFIYSQSFHRIPVERVREVTTGE